MGKVRFFSNNLIVKGGKESESTFSPKNTRPSIQSIFTVPKHNVGTKNLQIFVEGEFQAPDVHYTDINSHEIEFVQPISTNVDVYALLIKTGEDNHCSGSGGGDVEWEDF